MNIKKYRLLAEIHPVRVEPPITKIDSEILAIIDRQLKERSADRNFWAFAKPGSLHNDDRASWIPIRPIVSVIFQYKETSTSQDLPQVYADRETIVRDLDEILENEGCSVGTHTRHGDEKMVFDPLKHSLWPPLNVYFSEDEEGRTPVQKNEVIVRGVGSTKRELVSELRKYAKSQGCKMEIAHSKRTRDTPGDEAFSITTLNRTYGYGLPAPEMEVKFSWTGEDFDRKAITLFGAIRDRLYPRHIKMVEKYFGNLLKASYRHIPGETIVSGEGLKNEVYLGELMASMGSEVPFKHNGKDLVGHLSYFGFKGR